MAFFITAENDRQKTAPMIFRWQGFIRAARQAAARFQCIMPADFDRAAYEQDCSLTSSLFMLTGEDGTQSRAIQETLNLMSIRTFSKSLMIYAAALQTTRTLPGLDEAVEEMQTELRLRGIIMG